MRVLKLFCTLSIAVSAAACGASAPSPSSAPVTTSPTTAPTPATTPATTAAPTPKVVSSKAHDGLPGITYAIPTNGWRESDGIPMKGTEVSNVPEAAVLLWPFKVGEQFYVYGDPCKYLSTKPAKAATTVDEIASDLAAQASRNATAPVDVTIDGYHGKALTLHVPADATMTGEDFDGCEEGKFASYGIPEDPLSRYHQGPGQIDELWILDVGGSTVIIDAMYRSDTPADVIEEMQRIAEAATFQAP